MDNRERQASSKGATATAAVADLFGAGIKHHHAGRFAGAEVYYRRVLAAQPNHSDALNMLGVVPQPARLSELRHSLRPRMTASPLCDGPAFARKIEDAYRTIWQRWCAAPDPARP
jgi:hypothetical protein